VSKSDKLSGEDRLIARFFEPLATDPGALGLTDDAAVIKPPDGHDLVVTADMLVAGVHYFDDDPADDVARKALRVNLSDLAAKGARPLGFLLSIALPRQDEAWLAAFARGLGEDAAAYACPLFGGDTVKTGGPAAISISMFGAVPSGTMVRRRGARPGDRFLVSGTIGDAALGLQLRRGETVTQSQEHRRFLLGRYLLPQPRTRLAAALRACAHAAMDVSDGLAGDLAKLCRVSGVAAEVELSRVPLSPAAADALAFKPSLRETVLTGGDDYEIVCAVAPDRVLDMQVAARKVDVVLTEIGVVHDGEGVAFRLDDGSRLELGAPSFSHF
jgi:thiamine-monophosphate kinase